MQAAQLTGVDVLARGDVLESALQARDYLVSCEVPAALVAKDPRLWGRRAVDHSQLGWLDLPRGSLELLTQVESLITEIRYSGLDHVVLVGQGAEALAARAITDATGVDLTVVDGGGPLTSVLDPTWLERVFVVLSSKSGVCLEVEACRRIFEQALRDHGMSEREITHRFLVITDHGSPLDAFARDRGYRLGLTDPYLPGHYGALSAYGVVPAALAGAEVGPLLDQATALLPSLGGTQDNPGLLLGAILGGCALDGPNGVPRDKVVLRTRNPHLAGWIGQLLATATGKRGRGILPIDEAGRPPPAGYDLHSIALNPRSPATAGADTSVFAPLGAQFLLWEYAASVAAWLLGVNPFDSREEFITETEDDAAGILVPGTALPVGQPSFVEDGIEGYLDPALSVPGTSTGLSGALAGIIRGVPVNGYLSVVSYLPDGQRLDPEFTQRLAERIRRPVTLGSGPAALQGLGSYHKDGPRTGVFLVVSADAGHDQKDQEVPGKPYTLGELRIARALADVRALRRRRLPVVWLHLRDPVVGTARLAEVTE